MKLTQNVDLAAFLHAVGGCSGEVFFSSKQGDYLNLKSMLSQYLFSVAAGDHTLLFEGDISCENEQDCAVLQPYLITEQGD